nr:hypothetical protein [Tanacetum cinerariifolium]
AYTYYCQLKVNAAKNINGEAHIHAKVDRKKVIISEVTIRRDLNDVWTKSGGLLAGIHGLFSGRYYGLSQKGYLRVSMACLVKGTMAKSGGLLAGKDYAQNVKNQSKTGQYRTQDWKSTAKAESTGIFLKAIKQ